MNTDRDIPARGRALIVGLILIAAIAVGASLLYFQARVGDKKGLAAGPPPKSPTECSLTAVKVDLLGEVPADPALTGEMKCWIPLQSASFEVIGVSNGLVTMRYRSLCACHGEDNQDRPPQLGPDCPSPATVVITIERLRSWPINEDTPSCRERWERLVHETESFR